MTRRILVVGATSAIGSAIGRLMAARGYDLVLAGRDTDELDRIAADVELRSKISAAGIHYDALSADSGQQLFDQLTQRYGDDITGIVCCQGVMFDQREAERDLDLTLQMIETNYTSIVSLLHYYAAYFESKSTGFICVLGSVAGDRGRQSNYIYGSTKAGLAAYLAGLRNRLSGSGVQVLTVKPGFVDTAMTWGVLKSTSVLVASPERVALNIVTAIEKGKNSIYTPKFWWLIMLIIKMIPESVFKRLKL